MIYNTVRDTGMSTSSSLDDFAGNAGVQLQCEIHAEKFRFSGKIVNGAKKTPKCCCEPSVWVGGKPMPSWVFVATNHHPAGMNPA